jgi:plastocyanin
MHAATLHLAPILAAEKSRVPFYIAGGALVVWALIVSMAIGMRRPDFPGGQSGERAVIAISVVLVLATLGTAVITASTPAKSTPSATASPTKSAAAVESSTSATTAPAAGSAPTATTGTPAPPSSPAAGASTSALSLAANPAGQLSYDTRQLSAKAGKVTITMTNMSPLEHNVTIAQGTTVLGATPTFVGGKRTLTLELKTGTYTFYCSVPGHRQAGMEGTLTVSPA